MKLKNVIKCAVSLLIIAMAWVLIIEVAYGVANPSTKRIIFGMLSFIGMLCLAVYVIEPSIVNKRIYGIAVCIAIHHRVRRYCNNRLYEIKLPKVERQRVFEYMTGCYGYYDLYRYASQEEYFKK